MVPISLSELPKPSRILGKSQKPILQKPCFFNREKEQSLYSLHIPFKGPYQGWNFFVRLPYKLISTNLKHLVGVDELFVACRKHSALENRILGYVWILPTYCRGRIQYVKWFLDTFGYSGPMFEAVSKILGARSAPGKVDCPRKQVGSIQTYK